MTLPITLDNDAGDENDNDGVDDVVTIHVVHNGELQTLSLVMSF